MYYHRCLVSVLPCECPSLRYPPPSSSLPSPSSSFFLLLFLCVPIMVIESDCFRLPFVFPPPLLSPLLPCTSLAANEGRERERAHKQNRERSVCKAMAEGPSCEERCRREKLLLFLLRFEDSHVGFISLIILIHRFLCLFFFVI